MANASLYTNLTNGCWQWKCMLQYEKVQCWLYLPKISRAVKKNQGKYSSYRQEFDQKDVLSKISDKNRYTKGQNESICNWKKIQRVINIKTYFLKRNKTHSRKSLPLNWIQKQITKHAVISIMHCVDTMEKCLWY